MYCILCFYPPILEQYFDILTCTLKCIWTDQFCSYGKIFYPRGQLDILGVTICSTVVTWQLSVSVFSSKVWQMDVSIHTLYTKGQSVLTIIAPISKSFYWEHPAIVTPGKKRKKSLWKIKIIDIITKSKVTNWWVEGNKLYSCINKLHIGLLEG